MCLPPGSNIENKTEQLILSYGQQTILTWEKLAWLMPLLKVRGNKPSAHSMNDGHGPENVVCPEKQTWRRGLEKREHPMPGHQVPWHRIWTVLSPPTLTHVPKHIQSADTMAKCCHCLSMPTTSPTSFVEPLQYNRHTHCLYTGWVLAGDCGEEMDEIPPQESSFWGDL